MPEGGSDGICEVQEGALKIHHVWRKLPEERWGFSSLWHPEDVRGGCRVHLAEAGPGCKTHFSWTSPSITLTETDVVCQGEGRLWKVTSGKVDGR